jgi:hypothetical protein
MLPELETFLKGCHPSTRLLAEGSVTFLDHKDKEVTQPAILCRGAVYGQEWAWAVGKGGKIGSVLPMFFKKDDV